MLKITYFYAVWYKLWQERFWEGYAIKVFDNLFLTPLVMRMSMAHCSSQYIYREAIEASRRKVIETRIKESLKLLMFIYKLGQGQSLQRYQFSWEMEETSMAVSGFHETKNLATYRVKDN